MRLSRGVGHSAGVAAVRAYVAVGARVKCCAPEVLHPSRGMLQGAGAPGGSCRAIILLLSFRPPHASFLRDWFAFGLFIGVDGSFLACRSPSEVFLKKKKNYSNVGFKVYILSNGDVLLKRKEYLVAH